MPDKTVESVRSAPHRPTRKRGGDGRPRIAAESGFIEDLHILDEHGRVDDALDPNLDPADLMRIHRAMVLTRRFDIRMINMQRQGKMGTFAPGYGQEATQIGQVFPLTERDWYAPSYRSFGAQIWRGWPMTRLLLLWDGFFEGFPPPPEVNDFPFSIVIGSHVLPAVGTAMGMKYRGEDTVMVTNFGDGALSQGAVSEALNFAAVNAAPVIFICENNGWAISTPTEKQCAHEVLALRGPGFGVPAIRVDGNDVLAMIVATRRAVERARTGEGPTFIEAVTYRMGVHTTADNPKVYRDEAEVEQWKAKCPIARFERYLADRGILDAAGAEGVAEECEQEVLEARTQFYEQAVRQPREIFDYVFGELTPTLEAQKREYLAKLDRKGIE
ncbi:MAG: pyruvate dehydrogenase (acetyl-transferring) E1 component subunit alpha [Planctomycetes bacterium]|nr:pyruvate dehydrogenase (acetyl-transferring) E1 component subunit alpha [Planctomycetota bacterium]